MAGTHRARWLRSNLMWDADMRAAALTARNNARLLTAEGEHWRVYEVAQLYDRRRSQRLIFESDAVVRVVRTFPPEWRKLSDEELYELSWKR